MICDLFLIKSAGSRSRRRSPQPPSVAMRQRASELAEQDKERRRRAEGAAPAAQKSGGFLRPWRKTIQNPLHRGIGRLNFALPARNFIPPPAPRRLVKPRRDARRAARSVKKSTLVLRPFPGHFLQFGIPVGTEFAR